MDIRFWLRRSKRPGHAGTIYCTLTSAGVECTPFTTGIQAWPPAEAGRKASRPRQWQLAPLMRLYGETPDVRADNDTLAALHAKIRRLHTLLLEGGAPAGPREVAEALRGNGLALPTLHEAAGLFLEAAEKQLRAPDAPAWDKTGYAPATLRKYRSRLGLLTEYLRKQQQPHMPLARFTARHADGLVQMLLTRAAAPGKLAGRSRGQCGADYAGKVVGLVSQVLDFAVNQEWLAVNPLASYRAPHGFEKPLVYLLPEQVTQLEGYAFASEYLQRVADSFLFSCWTGLAWADMAQFDAGRHVSASGWLEMLRQKTGVGFSLPLLPGAARLLAKYPDGLPHYQNQPLNRMLKQIALLLGWELELTHHVGRRTFGMFLLNEGLQIETVSAVLGHRNVRTTQKHYATFLERRRIAKEFEDLQQRLQG